MSKNKNKLLIVLLISVGIIVSYITFTNTNNNDNETVETLNNRIVELETEKEAIKDHYRAEYELRNRLDLKARSIYKAIVEKDLDTLETAVTNGTRVLSDSIIFVNDNHEIVYHLYDDSEVPVLRQRYYELSSDKTTFITGYEVYMENATSVPVIIMTFTYENEAWKLSSIVSE